MKTRRKKPTSPWRNLALGLTRDCNLLLTNYWFWLQNVRLPLSICLKNSKILNHQKPQNTFISGTFVAVDEAFPHSLQCKQKKKPNKRWDERGERRWPGSGQEGCDGDDRPEGMHSSSGMAFQRRVRSLVDERDDRERDCFGANQIEP